MAGNREAESESLGVVGVEIPKLRTGLADRVTTMPETRGFQGEIEKRRDFMTSPMLAPIEGGVKACGQRLPNCATWIGDGDSD